MCDSQVTDITYCRLPALDGNFNPHFNFSPCDELIVGGEEGSRFLLPLINNQLIMSKQTTEPTAHHIAAQERAQKSLLTLIEQMPFEDILPAIIENALADTNACHDDLILMLQLMRRVQDFKAIQKE